MWEAGSKKLRMINSHHVMFTGMTVRVVEAWLCKRIVITSELWKDLSSFLDFHPTLDFKTPRVEATFFALNKYIGF